MKKSYAEYGRVFINNGVNKCLNLFNKNTGIGLYFENFSTGVLSVYNSITASTGDLLQFKKNSVITTKIDHNGMITTPPATLSNQVVVKSQLSTQYEVGTNSNVLDVWMDNEVIFTASCTITVPATLPTNFNFNWLTLAGVTVTWAITSPHTWLFGTPGNATEKTYGRMVKRNSTNSIIML